MRLRQWMNIVVLSVGVGLRAHAQIMHDDPGDQRNGSLDDLLSVRVSTASLYSQLAREAPGSVSIVGADEIARYQIRTLAELVSFVRGFYLSNDRNYEYVGVRGFGRPTDYNDRILLLWNGHAMNDNVYASAALGADLSLDLHAVERVEIVRGPGSPLYGANAMLAVINIIGRTGADVNGGEAAVEYGSGHAVRGSVLYGVQVPDGVDAVFSGTWMERQGFDLSFPEFDAPETNNGVVRNGERERSVGASGRVVWGDLTLMGIFSNRTKRIPTAPYGTTFADTRAMTEDQRWGLELHYARDLSPSIRLAGRLSFDGYDYGGVYPYAYLQFDGTRGRWWTGRAHLQWDTHEANRLDVGAELRLNPRADYRTWTEASYDYYRNAPYDVVSVFLQDSYQVHPDIALSLALRADHHSVSGWLLSPRATMVANPSSRSTIKVLYGEAFRAPSVYELYYEDNAGLVSNPSLRDERIRTLEVAAEQRLSSLIYASLSVYQFTMWNIIEQTALQGEELGQHQNIGSAHARGIEGEVIMRSPTGHTAALSVGTQYSEGIGAQPELVNSPRTIIGVSGSIRFLERCEVAIRGRYESRRTTVYGSWTDPFVLVHLFLHVNRVAGVVDLALTVRNVFDTRYAYPGGWEHRQASIVQDGRTIDLRAALRW